MMHESKGQHIGKAPSLHLFHSTVFFFVFFSSLTAVPSENQCMLSGAYEWPVLVSLKHAVGLSQHWFSKFLLQECF